MTHGLARPGIPQDHIRELIEAWKADLSPRTFMDYGMDLKYAAQFVGLETPEELLQYIAGLGKVGGEHFALKWKKHLLDTGRATATVGRRLTGLRSAISMLRRVGLLDWSLETRSPIAEPVRDVKGPTLEEIKNLWAYIDGQHAEDPSDPLAARNRALFRMMWDHGLRISEVLGTDWKDYDKKSVSIIGKGRRAPKRLDLAPSSIQALEVWRALTPFPNSVPIFVTMAAPHIGKRLGIRSTRYWFEGLGVKVIGKKVRPHGIRHSAITYRLADGLPLHVVQHFARHHSPKVTAQYNDRKDEDALSAAVHGANLLGEDGADIAKKTHSENQ